MVIYVDVDVESRIEGWGSSPISDNSIEIDIEENHDMLEDNPSLYVLNDFNQIVKASDAREVALEGAKKYKKQALSQSCQEDILDGFELEIDNKTYTFSYDREAQINYHERWQLFQNEVIEEMIVTAHLGDEDVRLTVDKDMFNDIYLASVNHKEDKIKRLREDIYPVVDMAQSEEELKTITWDMKILDPEVSGLILRDDRLLDKQIDATNKEADRMKAEISTTNRSILELATIALGFG